MKFDIKRAEEIVSKYKLSKKTVRVWKMRDKIPDKYSDDNYNHRIISKAGNIKHERLFDLLNSGTINIAVLAGLTGIGEIKFADAKRDKTRLSDADVNKCIAELKRLKITIAKAFKTYQPFLLEKLLNNPLIHYSKVIKNKELISQVSYVRNRKVETYEALWINLKDEYIIFAMTLNL